MKQINLLSKSCNILWRILPWVLLIVVLWFNGCSGNSPAPKTTKVTVPETKGKFDFKVPDHVPIQQKPKIVTETNTVYVENKLEQKLIDENKKIKADFKKANDSIKELMFAEKAKLNKYSSDFENDDFKLNVSGIVEGEIKTMTPSYTIKEKKVEVPIKQTKFRLLLGAGVGVNKQLNQGVYKADINFQNAKGDIKSFDYLKINDQDYFLIGYKKSIFEIKK
jgi:hypothetical protein